MVHAISHNGRLESIDGLWVGYSVTGLEDWVKQKRGQGRHVWFLLMSGSKLVESTNDLNRALRHLGGKPD